jgi:hypothetical protein
MAEAMPNLESLLREALRPVEPPADLVERLESTLTTITALAADELEAWELSAMRDPRNWARPAAAVVAGSAAGAALFVLRTRRRGRGAGPWPNPPVTASDLAGVREAAERAVRDFSRETRKLLGDL